MSEITETVAGVRLVAIKPDGTEVNITEGVEMLYDLTRDSLDWGSGFIPIEKMSVALDLAITCGFPDAEKLKAEIEEIVAAKAAHVPGATYRRIPTGDPVLAPVDTHGAVGARTEAHATVTTPEPDEVTTPEPDEGNDV